MVRYMYLDFAAFMLLLIMGIFAVYRRTYIQKSGKIFLFVTAICMIACIFDILSVFPNVIGLNGLWISTTGYFIFRNFMPVAYLFYVMYITDPYRNKRLRKRYISIMIAPFIVVLILLLINPLLPHNISVFYYTNDLVYTRGILIYLLYLNSAVYMIVGVVWILKYREFFTLSELIAMFAIFPLTIVSVLIQMIRPELLVELFVSSLALILVQIVIERQEIVIDQKTGLKSKKIFIDFIKRSYAFKRKYYIILVNISNFNEIFNLLSYDEAKKYVLAISAMLEKKYKIINPIYESFYVDLGTYALIFKDYKEARSVSESIINDLSTTRLSNTNYFPDSTICIIDSLYDFKNFDELIEFTTSVYSKFSLGEKITVISEVKNDSTFIIKNNIDEIIDTAIDEDEFVIYYQPIINMKEKKYKSAEALVRLVSKKYGFINPGLFIPYAEKNGRISDIDTIVMKKVFSFISSDVYKKLGLDYIEINLSMVDCMDDTLADRIISLMEEYKIDPKSINLEITESYDSLNNEISKKNIEMLEKYGIDFSLDDYGTGYSNIERFSKAPIKIVKIDKSLVDSANDKSMRMVLENTFKLISNLNRETVVEGIETKEQVILFEELGCNYIQGYYFSKPLPLKDFIKFIEEQKDLIEV